MGAARTSACRRTRPSFAPSKRQKPGESLPSPRSVGSLIGTNVAPPETRVALSGFATTLFPIIEERALLRGPADLEHLDRQQSVLYCVRITGILRTTQAVCIEKPGCTGAERANPVFRE